MPIVHDTGDMSRDKKGVIQDPIPGFSMDADLLLKGLRHVRYGLKLIIFTVNVLLFKFRIKQILV